MIYFMQLGNGGPIKIGFSENNVERRRDDLQVGLPYKLHIIGIMKGDELHEQSIHSLFNEYHLVGEWFTPNEELFNFITQNTSTEFSKYIDPKFINHINARIDEFKSKIKQDFKDNPSINMPGVIQQFERELITEAMKLTNGVQLTAASLLGISRSTLNQKIKSLWGELPKKRGSYIAINPYITSSVNKTYEPVITKSDSMDSQS